MHELAIAEAVVDLALQHAGGRRVTTVHLRVGHLRQVVPSALHFSFELVTRDTAAEGAVLEVETVPAAGTCRQCGAESALRDFPLCCERCGSFDLAVVRGEELEVEWLDLEEWTEEQREVAQGAIP